MIKTGRYVVLDEKHKGVIKFSTLQDPWKDPEWGNWNTNPELSSIGPKTGVPIVNCLLLLTSIPPHNVTRFNIENNNNFNLDDVHKEVMSSGAIQAPRK